MKPIKRKALLASLLAGGLSCLAMTNEAAAAAEDPDLLYTLDPIVVTASRYETKDLDVPATTSVYNHKQLEATGATTVEGALRYATGIVYKAETVGSGGGEFLIRGKRRGTLVMVDGVPINVRTGYYDLDNISLNDVERIEVIRGGGAVLYGSDATGGVINIITREKKANTANVSFGNFGQQKHSLSIQEGKFGVGVAYEKMGARDHVSLPSMGTNKYSAKYFNFEGGHKEIVSLAYTFDDALKLQADYARHDYERSYYYANKPTPVIYDYRDISDDEYKLRLHYVKDGWKANLFYHKAHDTTDYTYWDYAAWNSSVLLGKLNKTYVAESTDKVFGFDVQKEVHAGRDTYLIGLNAYRESYDHSETNKPQFNSKTGKFTKYYAPTRVDYARNVSSFFASWSHPFDERNSTVVSARETWTSGTPGGSEYSQFTPQIQYLYKVNDATSLYASVSKSFTLPTMSDMYGKGSTAANPGIRPEIGWHYETGIKRVSGGHQWKLALFKSDVKDFIRLKTVKVKGMDVDVAMNEDTRNLGVELTCDIAGKNGWSTNWGVSYSNPEFYYAAEAAKGWQRSYGRLHLTGGVQYQKGKWSCALSGSYLYDRVLQNYQTPLRPLFITGLSLSYRPRADHEVYLNVDNLFNREDITSHVLSRYVALSTNFTLGYRIRF
ncbi:MAG: TonB-dependent receptor [Schwartzia sp. (in: firmicutes)]